MKRRCAYRAMRSSCTLVECKRAATHGAYCKRHYERMTREAK